MGRLQRLILGATLLFAPFFMVAPAAAMALPTTFGADCSNSSQSCQAACSGISQLGNSGQDCGTGGSSVNKLIATVVNILTAIIGAAAVIMILVAGIRYLTSGGDSGNVTNAKNTLIYAIVGIFIAVLAQFFVRFALTTAASTQTCPTNSNIALNDPKCK